MFGPNEDIAVMKIEKTSELMELYSKIHGRLLESGAVYNEPNYQGVGFLPHSTIQKSGKLITGQKANIDSVSIIDLFPNGDGCQRKVFKAIELA